MKTDPLSFFLDEKTAAAAAPNTAVDPLEQKPFTKDPDRQSADPGERAMAGIYAVGSTAVGTLLPVLGNMILRGVATADTVPIAKQIPSHPIGKLQEFGTKSSVPKARLMGLFDVKQRVPKMPKGAVSDFNQIMDMVGDVHRGAKNVPLSKTIAAANPVAAKAAHNFVSISEMSNVVDSFIDKHNLKKKGVTINLKSGPLNFMSGPRYVKPAKRVIMPAISKASVLHELGHAADYTSGRIGRFRSLAEPMLSRAAMIALPAALIAGDRIKELLPGTVDDKAIEFMQNNAPAIMGATLAATSLYPEAKASFLAVQHVAKKEGRPAALQMLKRLGPSFGTYVLAAIPAVIGMSLARKYMREAREEKAETDDLVQKHLSELEKTGGLGDAVYRGVRSAAKDIVHVGKQVGSESAQLLRNNQVLSRAGSAAREIGTDPVFAHVAVSSAVPAAMASLFLYGTNSGKEIRKRMDPAHVRKTQSGSEKGVALVHSRTDDTWREAHPLRFAGLVAAGAALSGGVMAKLFSDLARVL